MALGGGTFTVQNKVLPGTYINFVSAANASPALSDRGIVTMPLTLNWGKTGEIFKVTAEDFQTSSMEIFGYPYTSDKLKGLRDLFLNAKTLYAYTLGAGGKKAGNDYAEAVYPGTRGNDIKIMISKNADNDTLYDVQTLLDTTVIDKQTVETAAELVPNGFVRFKPEAELAVTAGVPLTGGENGTVDVAAYQDYLDKIQSYTYNVMATDTTDEAVKDLLVSFVKRMRDDMGVKLQLVLYNKPADYMGVINVKNRVKDLEYAEGSMVYWTAGAAAGCEVNRSCRNKMYDGSFTPDTDITQSELAEAISKGEFVFHRVGEDIRVLEDINSMTTVTLDTGEVFKDNQTVRVTDQIANDIAALFTTKYLGVVPNDESGRISLWSDIVKHHEQLRDIRAIENFSDSDIKVEKGNDKKSVTVTDAITVINTMSKLYMTVTVA